MRPVRIASNAATTASVELALDRLSEAQPRNPTRHRIAIGAIRGHCVVCICDGNYPRELRNLLSFKTIGVPVPIDPFVMMSHDPGDLSVVGHVAKDPFADNRVLLHLTPLI